jgi:serine protease
MVAAGAGVVPANAGAQDTAAPVVLSLWISHRTVDVVNGPVQVTVRAEVQDPGSGLEPGTPWLHPQNVRANYAVPGQVMTLVSGDRFQGTYESTFTFPEHITSGNWNFTPYLRDLAGNWDQLVPASVGVSVVSLEDKDAPTVTASLKSSNTADGSGIVDITDGPATVEITADAYDAGIGFGADTKGIISAGGLGYDVASSSTDLHRATFTATYTYPQYVYREHREWYDLDPRGWYSFEVSTIWDANGNTTRSLPVGRLLVATRPLRGKRPDLRTSEGSVTATWSATSDPRDYLLEVLEYEAEFAGAGSVRTVRTNATEASLDDLPAGTYSVRVRARNELGWGEWTTPSEPVVHTGAATPVTPAPVTFTDVDGTAEDTYTIPATTGVDIVGGAPGSAPKASVTVAPDVEGRASASLNNTASTVFSDNPLASAMPGRSPSEPPPPHSASPALAILAGVSGMYAAPAVDRAVDRVENYWLVLVAAVLVFALCGLSAWMWRRRRSTSNDRPGWSRPGPPGGSNG